MVGVGVASVAVLLGVGSVALVVAGLVPRVLGRPSVEVVDVGRWEPAAGNRIEVVTTVRVTDVSPVLAAVGDKLRARYHIDMNGIRVASGRKDGIELDADGTLQLRSTIVHENVPALWASYVQNDESITVKTGGELGFGPRGLLSVPIPPVERQVLDDETPVVDALTSAADRIADDYALDAGTLGNNLTGGLLDLGSASPAIGYEIERGWATWSEVTDEETTVVLHFDIRNGGHVPVPSVPEALDVMLEMNGVALFTAPDRGASLADATSEPPLAPGERRRVEYPITVDNEKVDAWFRRHVRNGERTHLTASVQLVFQSPVVGASVTLPPDRVPTVTCEVQTGLLVDQESVTTCDGPVGG